MANHEAWSDVCDHIIKYHSELEEKGPQLLDRMRHTKPNRQGGLVSKRCSLEIPTAFTLVQMPKIRTTRTKKSPEGFEDIENVGML